MVVIADILQLNRHRVPLALLRISAIRRDRRTLHYVRHYHPWGVSVLAGKAQLVLPFAPSADFRA